MSFYQAVLLGLIQGLTEFLPVSSSGHLVLTQKLMAIREPSLAFDAIVHLGTLTAVVVYFRRELALVAGSVWRWLRFREADHYSGLARYVVIGSIPAGLLGFTFEDLFSRAFESVPVVGLMLLLTGTLLWFAEARRGDRTLEKMGITDCLWVGLAQSAAIMPGLSRSGTTIAAGLFRGFDRQEAAKFSFLLSIPVIIGASGLAFLKIGVSVAGLPVLAAGTFSAAVSGFFAIALLMKIITQERLRLFAVYCFIVGSLAIAMHIL